MSWINPKSVAAMVVTALVAGAIGFLVEKQKADQLEAQIAESKSQLEKVQAEDQSAQDALAAREKEMLRLQSATSDLAKARNEVAQLRQQRDAAARTPAATPATQRTTQPSGFAPGTYVKRDALTYAGYGSPEATLQTLAWAGVNGQTNYGQLVVPADLPQGDQIAKSLMDALQATGPVFSGMQIMAEKTLADDRIEVLVKVDVQLPPGTPTDNVPPPYNIVPMVRIGNEWKMGGQPQDYTQDWGNSGQIKTFVQQ